MNQEVVKDLAQKLHLKKSIFFVAKGSAYPFAREATLKFKELCYIHAEAINAGELKHGPLAMINSSFQQNGTQ